MTETIDSLLGKFPLWVTGLIILAVLLVIGSLGYAIRRVHDSRHPPTDTSATNVHPA